jgi:acetyl-CoA C-acetyltransferase
MTSQTTKVTILAGPEDRGEVRAGHFPALFAMIARRHMYEYGGAGNDCRSSQTTRTNQKSLAHMRKVITMEQALKGKPISEPLAVFDAR